MSQSLAKIPVCISIAPDQLARLDQAAADLDRSRSWIAARAIDAFIALPPREPLPSVAEPPAPAGVVAPPGRSVGPAASNTGSHAPGVAGGGDHYTSSIERQLAHDLEVSERHRQDQERIARSNREYLANLGKV